ncbi:hypothetical protein K7432_016973 [Basidiobolus ranarum]|uniref:Extracellular membrane protein CFEM domain-containing protein n=1 Tax=Basidiobolus ranarum TaxID=34480 RepID=A0ABR2VKY6_9FUNG
MHFAIQVLAGIAAVSVVSASDYFPFKYPNDCITECAMEAGKKCWPNYTQDPNSPDFVESFACLCGSDQAKVNGFLTDSLNCMLEKSCPNYMSEAQLEPKIYYRKVHRDPQAY